MKPLKLFVPLLLAGFSMNAQTTRPPGRFIGAVDTVSWNSTQQFSGSSFHLVSGGTVRVDRLEKRLIGDDTCVYAVSASGRYYAMNQTAERHSGGGYAFEHFNIARPSDEVGANLYDAGRSLRMYQGYKLGSFGTGIAAGLALALASQNSNNSKPGSNTGVYLVSGALAGASIILGFLADGQVNRAGRLLQIASGKIVLGRR